MGARLKFDCPFCGSSRANATSKLDRSGEPRLFIGCFGESCPIPRRYYKPALAEALGLGASAEPEEIAATLLQRLKCDYVLSAGQYDWRDYDWDLSRVTVALVIDKYGRRRA